MTQTLPLPIYRNLDSFRSACHDARQRGQRVALVPTMGALHEGHFALVRKARELADFVAVSVFVNPTQFGPSEDFACYPRTLEQDACGCHSAGADCVFAPEAAQMYPPGDATRVHVATLTDSLCGRSRPGHFDGVATVVTKLFAVTGPCIAVFGKKDYQQFRVIDRLVKDLLFDVHVVAHPIVREHDGLALSSRNRYLSPEQRALASRIPQGLTHAVQAFQQGERNVGAFTRIVTTALGPLRDTVDYVSITDALTLQPMDSSDHIVDFALLALAVRVGSARLIDNVVLGQDPAPVNLTENQP